MSKVFTRLVLAVLLTTLFFNASIVSAAQQNSIEISSLYTDILPEYDTADILVVNTIKLKNTSTEEFNGDLRWSVPTGSKSHIVADDTGSQTRLSFSLAQNNGVNEMVWRLSSPLKPGETRDIHLEYYYNNLQGGPDKTFSFEFQQGYPIVSGIMAIYQPAKATNFKLEPEMGPLQTGQQFKYYQKNYANQPPNQKISFSASYTKSDPNPSVTTPPNGQAGSSGQAPAPSPTQSSVGINRNLGIIAIAGLAIVIILLGAKIMINNRKLAEFEDSEYEDDEDYDEDDEDYTDEDEEYEGADEEGAGTEAKAQAYKLAKDYQAGRITEEEYHYLLEELKVQ